MCGNCEQSRVAWYDLRGSDGCVPTAIVTLAHCRARRPDVCGCERDGRFELVVADVELARARRAAELRPAQEQVRASGRRVSETQPRDAISIGPSHWVVPGQSAPNLGEALLGLVAEVADGIAADAALDDRAAAGVAERSSSCCAALQERHVPGERPRDDSVSSATFLRVALAGVSSSQRVTSR